MIRMKAIQTEGLSKTYWFYEKEAGLSGSLRSLFKGRRVFVEAVKDLTMNMDMGEVVGFIGPNGAGKTTTLKMLCGILYPTHGELTVMGYKPSRREKPFLKCLTLISGQRNRLFWDLPAEEYFEFCRVVYEIPESVYKRNLEKLLELAEIGDIMKVPQRKLSFGQRKHCELVAGLLHDPKIILLDEPTNAMDLIYARRIREFIKNLGKEGRHTIILTSHNISDIEQVCQRVIIINHGMLVFDGTISDLRRYDGIRKKIHVLFNGAWNPGSIEKLGKIRKINSYEISIEVENDKAAEVASQLFASYPVKDISITEPELETIIESIYQSGRNAQPLDRV